jgi:hypothetical protein
MPTLAFNNDSAIIQKYSDLNVVNSLLLGKSGSNLAFQRKVEDGVYNKLADNKYKEMCFVIQSKIVNQHIFQYNNHYKFTYYVNSNIDVDYKDAKFWFLQGFRLTGNKVFKALDKVFGTFSLYINNNLIVQSDSPKTIFSDDSLETGALDGTNFTLKLNKGVNKIEICISPFDSTTFDSSIYDSNTPYLQLSITPSLFDEEISVKGDFDIESIYAEPSSQPQDEFDLIWNLKSSPTYWAWNSDKTSLMFNYKPDKPIDGYFKGSPVNYKLNYKNNLNTTRNPIYLRFDFKASSSKVTPVLNNFKLSIR